MADPDLTLQERIEEAKKYIEALGGATKTAVAINRAAEGFLQAHAVARWKLYGVTHRYRSILQDLGEKANG